MIVKIGAPAKPIRAEINLPASKSISNRALIIHALSGKDFPIENLSEADDTKILLYALATTEKTIDVGAAGTAMRFLAAYFAVTEGEKILTGTERMKQRPIQSLVDALTSLGADIEYVEKAGFPPLKINGKKLSANEVEADGSISSQYLSALLMIAPALPNGLTITIKDELVSKPYAAMTTALMKQFGVESSWQGNLIEILPQNYQPAPFKVEPDWSAAAFWYSVVALSNDAEIKLNGLAENSLQGDSVLPKLMKEFGVETEFSNDGILLKKIRPFDYAQGDKQRAIKIDFTDCPDLAQSLTVLAAALDIEIEFTGIENLKLKETDRISALQNELKKIGKEFVKTEGCYILRGKFQSADTIIQTYDDHRMVMAFAPLSLLCENLRIENPETVSKSYPLFLQDLKNCGWNIIPGK